MKSKHEQLYVAVQDLLIELNITPERLRDIAANKTHGHIQPTMSIKTAQKLIDADLIVEEVNWRKPVKSIKAAQRLIDAETMFNKIKDDLHPADLWRCLREKYPEFLHNKTGWIF